MRIESLEVPAFGALVDFRAAKISGGLVIVHGTNESGKSTLVSILDTLLYGFQPLKDFPYRPGGGERHPELRAALHLGEDKCVEVSRRLMSVPGGTMVQDGHATELANRELPFARHVGRDLYRALYAPRREHLHLIGESQKSQLDDRLLSGFGDEVLVPARQAVAALEDDAAKLWRPDRRGKPQHALLKEQLREARAARDEARRDDEQVRQNDKRLVQIEVCLVKIENDLAGHRASIRRADELLPVKQKLDELEQWRRQIPEPEALAALPEAVQSEHRRLQEKLAEFQEKAEQNRDEQRSLIAIRDALSEDDRRFLGAAEALRGWSRKLAAHEQEKTRLGEMTSGHRELATQMGDACRSIFSAPWEDGFEPRVRRVSLPDLKLRIQQYTEQSEAAERSRRDAGAGAAGPVSVVGALPPWTWALAGAAGGAALLIGLLLNWPWLGGLGAAALLLAVGILLNNARVRREQESEQRQRRARADDLEAQARRQQEQADEARDHLKKLLDGLPVAEALLERPDVELHSMVAETQNLASRRHRLAEELASRSRTWQQEQEDLQALVESLEDTQADGPAVDRLVKRLDEAEQRRRDAARATTQTEQLEVKQKADATKTQHIAGQVATLEKNIALTTGAQSCGEDAPARAAALQRIAQRILQAEEQLIARHPNLADLRARITEMVAAPPGTSGGNPPLDASGVEMARMRIEELDGQRGPLIEERATLKQQIRHTLGATSVGELDGRIEQLEEQMKDLCTQRDRLTLLASVLREADRRFRDRHQPDVLKRAGDYLEKFTAGRYRRLLAVEDESRPAQLLVRDAAGHERPVAWPLSSGTLDQIYMAFRLAVIDHLDEDQEPLPLVFDEALIHWDERRFAEGVTLLKHIAVRRQVFLFTCHRWLADRLAETTGAGVIELPDRVADGPVS